MEKDFYEVLGLTEEEKNLKGEAFEKVLKDKYKKLAKKWHPDRFATKSEEERKEAEDTFKGISEAYDTLSDSQKRQQYDFEQGGFGGFEGDPFAGFSSFFGGGFNPFAQGMHQQARKRGRDIMQSIRVSLKDAFNGCTKNFEYFRNVPCSHCNGTGSKTGKTTVCPHCNGTGQERIVQSNGYMQSINVTTCRHCGGTGVINEDPCPGCSGSGMERIKVNESINIAPGTLPGTNLVKPGMGEVVKEGQPGNLIVNVDVYNSDGFSFNSNGDLVYVKDLPMIDAVLGIDFNITMLDGSTRTIKVPEVTPDGKEFRFKGIGFPIYRDGTRGDVVVKIKYVYPQKLTAKQRELLKKVKDKK